MSPSIYMGIKPYVGWGGRGIQFQYVELILTTIMLLTKQLYGQRLKTREQLQVQPYYSKGIQPSIYMGPSRLDYAVGYDSVDQEAAAAAVYLAIDAAAVVSAVDPALYLYGDGAAI